MLRESLTDSAGKRLKQIGQSFSLATAFIKAGNDTINHPKLKQMIKDEKFDLIITGFFMNSFLFGIAEEFDCPIVIVSVVAPMISSNGLVGNPVGIFGVPHVMFSGIKTVATFFARVKNFFMYLMESIMMFLIEYKSKQIYEYAIKSDHFLALIVIFKFFCYFTVKTSQQINSCHIRTLRRELL